MVEASIPQLLFRAAQQDLDALEVLAPLARIGDAIVGFHAHQCVEKAIKAVLSSGGISFRRTHDLAELLDLPADRGVPAPPYADTLDELNPYAVEARYGVVEPSGLDRRTLGNDGQDDIGLGGDPYVCLATPT